MKKILITICTICFWQISFSQEVALDSVKYYIGESITVCAEVQGTYVTKGESKVTYINFGAPYPNTTFTAVIFKGSLENFKYNPAEVLKGKKVCITGKVTTYKEKPQIIVNNEVQIFIETP